MKITNLDNPEKPADCTINGKCTQCGSCCPSMLPVTKDELVTLRNIAKTVTPHAIKATPDTITVDFTCPFLSDTDGNDKHKCSIYDKRPFICRTFTCQVLGKMTNKQLSKLQPMSDIEIKHIASSRHYNLWNLFNKTGLVFNGRELPLDEAPVMTLYMDDGTEKDITIGTYVELPDMSGDIVKGMLAGADNKGIHLLTPYREIITIPIPDEK